MTDQTLVCATCHSHEANECRYPDETPAILCDDCAKKAGFCVGCGYFCAGIEDYDFSPLPGYCGECVDTFEYETGEYDDEDDPYDEDYY